MLDHTSVKQLCGLRSKSRRTNFHVLKSFVSLPLAGENLDNLDSTPLKKTLISRTYSEYFIASPHLLFFFYPSLTQQRHIQRVGADKAVAPPKNREKIALTFQC